MIVLTCMGNDDSASEHENGSHISENLNPLLEPAKYFEI